MSTLLKLENMTYGVQDRTILQIPSLSIEQGEIIGIMGPNGAGKSTLLKILSLLDSPRDGSLFFKDTKLSAHKVTIEMKRKFAIALQQSLLLNTSVYQNVALGLKIRKLPKREINEKVEYWLNKFNIAHLAKKHAYHLSGGEAQRVNLARAMVIEPEVLFLDEPFSALDFPTKVQLLKELKEILKATETTTVFVSHDLLEIKYLTDRLAILMDGEIKQLGNTLDVIEHPNEITAPFIQEWKEFIL
ncbi:ABC transporter ATP-binding protein [Robertmurraya yapensis]|uniref:ABC transporter ATP-binding protein n=1 Tax=Bacillus yapensis TaxID=2492960 RepID=A0A3S0KRH4_9BACI|nr:ABC transporter ATP-binding protein [Bacillus yapensis]RTR36136.1 ABC transporter ATP-binding protein [Bacillus yapensis]TKT05639.1 ATP-binding cassette domain-containing protein [Bacillus yapensis]